MNAQTALVLSPHTDDGELGCGGTMAHLAREGRCRVHYAAFSRGSAIDREVLTAVRYLGVRQSDVVLFDYPTRYFHERRQDILQDLIGLRDRLRPDLVFCPTSDDHHQDHQVITQEAVRAFKAVTLLGYELPWNQTVVQGRCFWPLEKQDVQDKARALACYASQAKRVYMRPEFIWGLAVVRGVQIGVEFAEAFEVLRWVQRR